MDFRRRTILDLHVADGRSADDDWLLQIEEHGATVYMCSYLKHNSACSVIVKFCHALNLILDKAINVAEISRLVFVGVTPQIVCHCHHHTSIEH